MAGVCRHAAPYDRRGAGEEVRSGSVIRIRYGIQFKYIYFFLPANYLDRLFYVTFCEVEKSVASFYELLLLYFRRRCVLPDHCLYRPAELYLAAVCLPVRMRQGERSLADMFLQALSC